MATSETKSQEWIASLYLVKEGQRYNINLNSNLDTLFRELINFVS